MAAIFGTILLAFLVALAGCQAESKGYSYTHVSKPTLHQEPTPALNAAPAPATPAQTEPVEVRFTAQLVVGGLSFATSFAFAPDGRLFVAERLKGQVLMVENGRVLDRPFLDLQVVTMAETGLLGLALHPQFESNPYVYVYYTYWDEERRPRNRLSRFRDAGNRAGPEEVLISGLPAASIHNGGAIAFGPDGKLYVPIGDTTDQSAPQNLSSVAGKIHRINPDGSIPEDNPFKGSAIFSYGHRNVFGLAWHPVTRRLYATENGPTRDDEINIIKAGGNYGWPLVVGKAEDPKFVDPILTYTPNIAPTGIAFYTGDRLPSRYRNGLFFGDWNTGSLRHLALEGPDYARVAKEETVVQTRVGGIVAVVNGPDGFLYFSTPGGIYRLVVTQ